MSEHAPTTPVTPSAGQPQPSSWGDRLYAARAVAAVALAGVLMGSLGGVALGHAGGDASAATPGRGGLPGQTQLDQTQLDQTQLDQTPRGEVVPADRTGADETVTEGTVPQGRPDGWPRGSGSRRDGGGPPALVPPSTAPRDDVVPDAMT